MLLWDLDNILAHSIIRSGFLLLLPLAVVRRPRDEYLLEMGLLPSHP